MPSLVPATTAQRRARVIVGALVTAVLLWGGWMVEQRGFVDVRAVQVHGTDAVAPEDVREAVLEHVNGSLIRSDLAAAQRNVSDLPTVEEAHIAVADPVTLAVTVDELPLVASVNGYAVDRAGYITTVAGASLPRLTTTASPGDTLTQEWVAVVHVVEQWRTHPSTPDLRVATRQGDDVELVTDAGMRVRLGADAEAREISVALSVKEATVQQHGHRPDMVDVRVADRPTAVRCENDEAAEAHADVCTEHAALGPARP